MLIDSGRVDDDDGLFIADSTKEKTKSVASQKRKSALLKARAKITPFETALQVGMTEVPTLTECANLRGLGETMDIPAFLANWHLTSTASANAYIQRPPAQEQSDSIVKPQETCFTSMAPPRRSPAFTHIAARSNQPFRPSVVSSLLMDGAKAPSESYQYDRSLAPSHLVPSSGQPRSRLAQDTAASYQREHTQWQNNRAGMVSRLNSQNKIEISAQMTGAMISIPDSDYCTASSSIGLSRVPSVVQPLVLANADSSAFLMTYLDVSNSLLKGGDPLFDMVSVVEIKTLAPITEET